MTLAELYAPLAHITDKGTDHSYIDIYEELLAPYRDKAGLRLLEIGVDKGGSLLLWSRYFRDATVVGVDITDERVVPEVYRDPKIRLVVADATCATCQQQIGSDFDIVIDDGSHETRDQARAFFKMFSRVRPGGLYVVEDVRRNRANLLRSRLQGRVLEGTKMAQRRDDRLVVVRKP